MDRAISLMSRERFLERSGMNPSYTRWQWLKDRLATVQTWRLLLFLVMPIGFSAFFFVTHLRAGRIGWAAVFGVILALSVIVEVAAWIIRIARRRQGQAQSN